MTEPYSRAVNCLVELYLPRARAHTVGYYNNENIMDLIEDIIDLDPQMRFAAVIDKEGNIIEAIMKSGKTSLKSQKDEEYFCRQVAKRRDMRHEFDSSLGRVSYVHVEREKVTQMVVYPKNHTVYFTIEPEMLISEKLRIMNTIKGMVSEL